MLEIKVKRRTTFRKKKFIGFKNIDLRNFKLLKDISGDKNNENSYNLFVDD